MKKSTDQFKTYPSNEEIYRPDEFIWWNRFSTIVVVVVIVFIIAQNLTKIKLRESSVSYEDEINLTSKISKGRKEQVQINLCYEHRNKTNMYLKNCQKSNSR